MDEEGSWKQAMYERIVADQRVKSLAWEVAEGARREGDPELAAGDLQAARRYLRRCIFNMSVIELQQIGVAELAGLLARGAVGAAAYRVNGAAIRSGRSRRRKADR